MFRTFFFCKCFKCRRTHVRPCIDSEKLGYLHDLTEQKSAADTRLLLERNAFLHCFVQPEFETDKKDVLASLCCLHTSCK